MDGYNSLPLQSGRNPYLDEIDAAAQNAHAQLSPGAQMALRKAGAPVGMTGGAPAPPQQITNPRPAPPALAPMSENMPNGQPAMMAGTGITMPTPRPQPVPPTAATAPAQKELERLTVGPQATAGVNQIHNPWARVPLQILAGIGETFAPRLAAALPGTESHHQLLVGEAENAVKQQQGIREAEEKARTAASTEGLQGEQGRHLGAETDTLIPAQANEANARAYALMHPAEKAGELGKTVQTDQGILQLNPETGRYDIFVGGVPSKEGGTVHQLDDGTLIIAKPDGKGVLVTVDGQPVKGKVTQTGESTDVKNYEYAKQQGYKGTFEQWQKDEANRKTPKPPSESVNWQLQEDKDGNQIWVNPRTRETAPAGDVRIRGTAEKDRPVKDALAYAEQYINGGHFSASGDLALMDQFYQAAKPKRMNEKQNQLLMEGQSVVQSIRQKALHALTPDAPYFDDTQRQNIVQTMRDLAKSQTTAAGAAPEAKPSGATVPNVGETFQGGKVLKVTKIK